MSVTLVMFKADGTRRDFPVAEGAVVIGRKNTCDLRIPLTSVSRQHCEIVLKDGEALLRDLGSSNGTFHNGKRVQQAELNAGDEIAVGPVLFTVVIDGRPGSITPTRTILGGNSASGTVAMPATTTADASAGLSDSGLELPDARDLPGPDDGFDLDADEHIPVVSLEKEPDAAGSSMFEIDFDDDSNAGLDVEVLNEDDK